MPRLTTVHEAVQHAVLRTMPRTPGEPRIVCSSKVPEHIAERADRILKHEGTTINAFLGACLQALVEDFENAHREV